jgi:DNA-directed RNA polymerase subunit E'/Rpb7
MAAAASSSGTGAKEKERERGKTGAVRMGLFRPVYMDHRITLSPMELRDAAKDIDTYLTKKIRKRVEEKCCIHGWVRGGSTQILGRSMGQAEHCRFTGDFLYTCKIRVLCLLPETGQIVDAQILKINKGGAYALIVEGGRVTEAARIFVPRDLHLGNQAYDELQEEQVIRVRIQMSRFQANDPFIQAVGTFEGLSTAEVTVPAKKDALKPAVPPTEAAVAASEAEVETEEASSNRAYNLVKTEGGFSITRRGATVAEAATASSEGSYTNSEETISSETASGSSEGRYTNTEESVAVAVPAPAPTAETKKLQTNFAAILATASAAAPAPAPTPAEGAAENVGGIGGLFGNGNGDAY